MKLIPWYIAKSVQASVLPLILALEVQHCFWSTWAQVYRK